MFISPMLLHRVDEPFNNPDYLAELKLDGIRLIFSNIDGQVKLYTRHKTEVTNRFPELHSLPIPPGTILDGEIVITDTDGKPDFEAMQSRFLRTKNLEDQQHVSYCVFDVIYHKGENVSKLPLVGRKQLLQSLIPENTPLLSKVLSIEGKGIELFELCKAQGLEGIVLKQKDSKYEINKRSKAWLKVVNYEYDEVWIRGVRKKEFGLLLSFDDGRPAGIMELGVPERARNSVNGLVNDLKKNENENFIYFDKGSLKCRVKYRNLTKAGFLRSPSFVEFA
ncbi:ATP-dependent DNA ligase [Halalkalibacter akibai]|uniref:ATP-dependent DNA ligase n=1 Tax=Halalkalibacter akibai (strain ATCC 43226 / DSM 21942 / CIP 109018 / JCM 9157 / 1139) TaxID=1236973 RepID=W4QXT3_HALA3|nr:RNA ligase family protein [Halalkalibacter akibai]GAE36448.1 ATP-dependent DNA ligase [Halalkalibacter akibai JCM 9157]